MNSTVDGRQIYCVVTDKYGSTAITNTVTLNINTEVDEYVVGDLDNDTRVDSVDYLLVKRACFGAYTLSTDETKRADVDKSDKVDYLLIKRIAFGTYKV